MLKSDPIMPPLRRPNHEKFAQLVASGLSLRQSYRQAIGGKSTSAPSALAKRPHIKARIQEIITGESVHIAEQISRLAPPPPPMKRLPRILVSPPGTRVPHRIEVSREAVAREFAYLAFANMEDYVKLVGDDLALDFSAVTREQMAAIREVTVDTYMEDGRNLIDPETGRRAQGRIKRVRFKLYDKNAALMNLAKVMGWIVERSESTLRLEDRLAQMSPEERERDAAELAAKVRARLEEDRARQIEAEPEDVEYTDIPERLDDSVSSNGLGGNAAAAGPDRGENEE